jgi:iron(III) transport system ATP-binding protein
MGSNNRLAGSLAEVAGERGRLQGEGWTVWGRLRATKKAGEAATGLIRVERLRLSDGPGADHLRMRLSSALYLGERWEYLFHLGDLRIRVWGEERLSEGEYWVSVPEPSLWIF